MQSEGDSGVEADGNAYGDGGEHSNPAVTKNSTEKWRDVQEQNSSSPQSDDAKVVARTGEEILRDSADEIADSRVPPNNDAILRDSDPRTKTRLLNDFPQFHVVDDFHGEAAVCPARFVGGAFQELERTDPHVEPRMRIAGPVRIGSEMENESKKRNENFLPETNHFDVAEERKMIEVAFLRESYSAAENIRLETHVSVREKQPIPR